MGCAQAKHATYPSCQADYDLNAETSKENQPPKRLTHAKLLLLGAGESGKSTIVKQMRMIYGLGFTPE